MFSKEDSQDAEISKNYQMRTGGRIWKYLSGEAHFPESMACPLHGGWGLWSGSQLFPMPCTAPDSCSVNNCSVKKSCHLYGTVSLDFCIIYVRIICQRWRLPRWNSDLCRKEFSSHGYSRGYLTDNIQTLGSHSSGVLKKKKVIFVLGGKMICLLRFFQWSCMDVRVGL